MKLKVNDVYGLADGLTGLLDKELSTKVAYKIQKNHSKVMDEFEIADKIRQKLIKKFEPFKDKKGVLPKEKREEFENEFDDLMEQDVEIDLDYIYLDELGNTIKPRVLVLLEKVIKESKEEEK